MALLAEHKPAHATITVSGLLHRALSTKYCHGNCRIARRQLKKRETY